MLYYDFEYDGVCLSDLGYMVCSFSHENESTLDGSQITFNQTPIMMGRQHLLANAKYEECLNSEIDICKIDQGDSYISPSEEQEIRRWLSREKFHKFRPLSERYAGIYFIGSFNVQTYEFGGNVIGFHLEFVSDSPFGYMDSTYKFDVEQNGEQIIYDMSDKIGDSYVEMFITCKASGDLEITNLFDNRKTIIRNCSEGETISMKNPIIESSIEKHDSSIMNDFNFIFPKISNTYRERKNTYVFSQPCSVVFKHKELRKIGI